MSIRFDAAKFAACIKARRGCLSLHEVVLFAGVSASTLSRIEKRKMKPDMESFAKICHWLEASPAEFFVCEEKRVQQASTLEQAEQLLRSDETLPDDLVSAIIHLLRLISSNGKEAPC